MADFAWHFGKSPDSLGRNELRSYHAHLLRDRNLAVGTVMGLVAALRFFFDRTLKRRLPLDDIPYLKYPRRLPAILAAEDVARLIDSTRNLLDRNQRDEFSTADLKFALYVFAGTALRRAISVMLTHSIWLPNTE